MCALLPVKRLAWGFTGQVFLKLARFLPLSLRALFQGFWILTLISTLGSWGDPPVVDFWDLLAKISPLISRLSDSHPHMYWAHRTLPQLYAFGTCRQKYVCFWFPLLQALLHRSTSCRPLFWALIPGKPMASGLTYQVFLTLARFSTACHGWPLFRDSQPYYTGLSLSPLVDIYDMWEYNLWGNCFSPRQSHALHDSWLEDWHHGANASLSIHNAIQHHLTPKYSSFSIQFGPAPLSHPPKSSIGYPALSPYIGEHQTRHHKHAGPANR